MDNDHWKVPPFWTRECALDDFPKLLCVMNKVTLSCAKFGAVGLMLNIFKVTKWHFSPYPVDMHWPTVPQCLNCEKSTGG